MGGDKEKNPARHLTQRVLTTANSTSLLFNFAAMLVNFAAAYCVDHGIFFTRMTTCDRGTIAVARSPVSAFVSLRLKPDKDLSKRLNGSRWYGVEVSFDLSYTIFTPRVAR